MGRFARWSWPPTMLLLPLVLMGWASVQSGRVDDVLREAQSVGSDYAWLRVRQVLAGLAYWLALAAFVAGPATWLKLRLDAWRAEVQGFSLPPPVSLLACLGALAGGVHGAIGGRIGPEPVV